MLNSLIRMSLRNGFSVKTVNPAYTSVIGKLKYSKNFGISVHEAAAFAIARRGLELQEQVPKEIILLLKTKLQQNCVFLLLPWKKVKRIRKKYIKMVTNNSNVERISQLEIVEHSTQNCLYEQSTIRI